MVAGFALLGLLYYERLNLIVANKIDFEQVLPSAIREFAPVALMGCLLAGLLAKFLGAFSGTLNGAQAYLINDLYLKYFKPEASNRRVRTMNYVAGLFVVAVAVVLGFFAQDVNSLVQVPMPLNDSLQDVLRTPPDRKLFPRNPLCRPWRRSQVQWVSCLLGPRGVAPQRLDLDRGGGAARGLRGLLWRVEETLSGSLP